MESKCCHLLNVSKCLSSWSNVDQCLQPKWQRINIRLSVHIYFALSSCRWHSLAHLYGELFVQVTLYFFFPPFQLVLTLLLLLLPPSSLFSFSSLCADSLFLYFLFSILFFLLYPSHLVMTLLLHPSTYSFFFHLLFLIPFSSLFCLCFPLSYLPFLLVLTLLLYSPFSLFSLSLFSLSRAIVGTTMARGRWQT